MKHWIILMAIHVTSPLSYINATGDVLLSSGVVAYLGAFTVDFRQECTQEWLKLCGKKNIPCSKACTLIRYLGINYSHVQSS